MAAVTRLGLYGGPRPAYPGFSPAAASVALTGTVTSATEADIVAGGQTLILTVTNDTWAATVGADNAITTAIINGLDSDGVEAAGWNAVVKAGLTHTAVIRTSDTVVTITLPAFVTYDITADETITATVPASALTGAVETVASPTFDVSYVDDTATNTGGWEQRKQRDILRTETTEERRRRIRAAREALGIIEPVREIAAKQLPDEDIDAPPGESVEALQARLEIVLEALDRQQSINVRKRKAAAVLLLAV